MKNLQPTKEEKWEVRKHTWGKNIGQHGLRKIMFSTAIFNLSQHQFLYGSNQLWWYLVQLLSQTRRSGDICWWHILVSCSGDIFWWHLLVASSGDIFWWHLLVTSSGGIFWWHLLVTSSDVRKHQLALSAAQWHTGHSNFPILKSFE